MRLRKILFKKKLRRLHLKESKILKMLIKEITSLTTTLLLDKLSQRNPNYEQINSILEQLQTNYSDRILSNLESIIMHNMDTIVSQTNLAFASSGFSIVHPSQKTLQIIQANVDQHLSLIKTIPEDIIQSARHILSQQIGAFDADTLRKQLESTADITNRRAELIARDQTAKAVQAYRRARALDLGFTHYTWTTSKDERVSTGDGGHKYLDKRIYSYEHPSAIIDSNNTKGHPSQRVNCRCLAQPLLYDADTHELVKINDNKRGDYYALRQR